MDGEAKDGAASMLDIESTIRCNGVGVIRGALAPTEIRRARQTIADNLELLHNTRPTPSAGHLAGFHRYPALEPLHQLLTGNERVRAEVDELCGEAARTIGLSDITVNRSQPWHKDLLRGAYARHLGTGTPCAQWHGNVFKFLAYLQPGASLQVESGSHKKDISLSDDFDAVPAAGDDVLSIPVEAGDIVVLDICTTHRGSDEAAFEGVGSIQQAKMLVSTVFGNAESPLTERLELGNAIRLSEWMQRSGTFPPPEFHDENVPENAR